MTYGPLALWLLFLCVLILLFLSVFVLRLLLFPLLSLLASLESYGPQFFLGSYHFFDAAHKHALIVFLDFVGRFFLDA